MQQTLPIDTAESEPPVPEARGLLDENLEHRLGTAQSKGCVRIPATLNTLLDHYGVLDAEYERLAAEGVTPRVLKESRETVADRGRYVVIVDSGRMTRAPWTAAPHAPRERRQGDEP